MVEVGIGDQLRSATGGNPLLSVDAVTVAEAVSRADEQYPGFRKEVVSSSGRIRESIRIARVSDGADLDLDSVLVNGERITVMRAALAGG